MERRSKPVTLLVVGNLMHPGLASIVFYASSLTRGTMVQRMYKPCSRQQGVLLVPSDTSALRDGAVLQRTMLFYSRITCGLPNLQLPDTQELMKGGIVLDVRQPQESLGKHRHHNLRRDCYSASHRLCP